MNRLIYAASEHDADMLYATKFLAPDAFLYFEKGKERHVVLSQLEYDRGCKDAQVDRVHNQTVLVADLRRRAKKPVQTHDWIGETLRQQKIKSVSVSTGFPVGLADALRRQKIKIQVEDTLLPERAIKKESELALIRNALKVTAELLGHAIETIRSSRPNKKKILMLNGRPLTSERVQMVIRMEAARRGFEASHPIVAGGLQACDPHERGHGPLRANELIIIDIFPRDLKSGYWGDMTRTVVKGRATEAQHRQFTAVHAAQKLAIQKLRGGIDGQEVHRAVEALFQKEGYTTGNSSGRYEGFFHGTGHGLGLEIHESPRVSSASHLLQSGNVVTVEPGLYYAGVGGVRIEDVVVLRSRKCEQLSRFPVRLEI